MAITEKLLQEDNRLCLPGLIPYRKSDKLGFCNQKNIMTDWIQLFKDSLTGVGKNEKCGFIKENDIETIPCIYDEANSFCEGLSKVKKIVKHFTLTKMAQNSMKNKHFVSILRFI